MKLHEWIAGPHLEPDNLCPALRRWLLFQPRNGPGTPGVVRQIIDDYLNSLDADAQLALLALLTEEV